MGVVWSGGDLGDAFNPILDAYLDALQPLMEDIIQEAVESAKNYTASRGTAASGKAGRIETGAMINAIKGRIVENSRTAVTGEFGFIDEHEPYFTMQTTTGFYHVWAHRFIEPTLAIIDAAREAEANMGDRLGNIVAVG